MLCGDGLLFINSSICVQCNYIMSIKRNSYYKVLTNTEMKFKCGSINTSLFTYSINTTHMCLMLECQ